MTRRTASVCVGAIVLLGVLAPNAAATDILNTQQLIKGGNANSFDRNHGHSLIENATGLGRPPQESTARAAVAAPR